MSQQLFIDAAKQSFAFLSTDYGFRLTSVRRGSDRDRFQQVCFESDRVRVCVWHDPKMRDGDVQLRWLAATDPGESFTIGALTESVAGRPAEVQVIPDRADEFRAWLAEMARRLRQLAGPGLRGEAAFFERLRDRARQQVLEHQRSTAAKRANRAQRDCERLAGGDDPDQAMRIRTSIVAAFGREDWSEAVKLLESIDAYLTPLEREQLAYARGRSAI